MRQAGPVSSNTGIKFFIAFIRKIGLVSEVKAESSCKNKFLLAGIKKFIDTSRVKRIISEEDTAGVPEKVFLKNSLSEVCQVRCTVKILEKCLCRKRFLLKLQVISLQLY